MCLIKSIKAYLSPNTCMINFDAVDFSELRSEEVISFFWRSVYMKSFIAKRVISILVNLRYLRFKLLKYKDNNKKICNTFDHNFKNIPLYIMSNVSLERYYFVLYDGALTLKMSKMALNTFCDKTLHIFCSFSVIRSDEGSKEMCMNQSSDFHRLMQGWWQGVCLGVAKCLNAAPALKKLLGGREGGGLLHISVADPGGAQQACAPPPPKIGSTVIFFYNPFCIRML